MFTSDYTHVYQRSLNVAVDIDTTDEADHQIPDTTYDTTVHNESIDEHERASAVLAHISVLSTEACRAREPWKQLGSCAQLRAHDDVEARFASMFASGAA